MGVWDSYQAAWHTLARVGPLFGGPYLNHSGLTPPLPFKTNQRVC